MAVAKCLDCGERILHRTQRGFRLKDIKCPKCGGEMKRARYSGEAFEAIKDKGLKGQDYYRAVYV